MPAPDAFQSGSTRPASSDTGHTDYFINIFVNHIFTLRLGVFSQTFYRTTVAHSCRLSRREVFSNYPSFASISPLIGFVCAAQIFILQSGVVQSSLVINTLF